MKIIKLSTLVFALIFGVWLGCGGSSGGSGTGGSRGEGGTLSTGGALGTGGAVDGGSTAYDAPMIGREAGQSQEAGGQGGSSGTCGANEYVDCTGLTPDQCHDLITNPPTIPDCVSALIPGQNPTVPYPNCSAQ
jgi:hypothetical protein